MRFRLQSYKEEKLIDSDLSLSIHIKAINKSASTQDLQKLNYAFFSSWAGCCNRLLSGFPKKNDCQTTSAHSQRELRELSTLILFLNLYAGFQLLIITQ